MKLDWICSARKIQVWRTCPLPRYICVIQGYINCMSVFSPLKGCTAATCEESMLSEQFTSHLSTQNVPAPNEWGWIDDAQCGWLPIWMTIPEAALTCSELIKCGCKSSRGCTSCKCIKTGLRCTNLCTCHCEI